MKKLSKTQNMVLERIIAEVEKMRSKNLEEYLNEKYEASYNKRGYNETYEEWFTEDGDFYTEYYYNTCKGNIIVFGVNKRTLSKLQKFGYIDTIEEWYHSDEKIQVNLENCGIK